MNTKGILRQSHIVLPYFYEEKGYCFVPCLQYGNPSRILLQFYTYSRSNMIRKAFILDRKKALKQLLASQSTAKKMNSLYKPKCEA